MWEKFIIYLKDPLLVVKVQNFFGVIYSRHKEIYSSNYVINSNIDEVIHSDRIDLQNELNDIHQHKRYPSDTSNSSQSSCETDASGESASDEEIVCHVKNKFWYYLFVLGTALGDEIFYATFIPFWFWNIDGAVGRRVVLVWTIIMYIGKYNYLTTW